MARVPAGLTSRGRPDRRATPLTGSVAGVLPRPRPPRPARLVTLAAVVTLAAMPVVVACGGDDSGDGGGTVTDDTVVSDLELEPVDDTNDDSGDGTNGGTDTGSDKPVVEVPDELPTELRITDLEVGAGRAAEVGDSVWVDYVGVVTSTGEEFDNSYDRGQPFDVRLGEGRVIAGWDQGLVGVQAGGRRQLDIPAELAYGENPPPGSAIGAGDALTFVVDVRAVVAATGEDAEPQLDIEPSVGRTDLTVDDIVVGEGDALEAEDTAIVHLLLLRGDDLEVLESTWRFETPAEIVMVPGGAIDGLVDGMAGMRVGGLRVISMPPELAFGPEGIPEAGLPADTDVILVVELLGRY